MKRAPVQMNSRIARGRPGSVAGTVSWEEHVAAWEDYASRYGTGQSAETIAERAGFCYLELTDHLGHAPTTWQPVK